MRPRIFLGDQGPTKGDFCLRNCCLPWRIKEVELSGTLRKSGSTGRGGGREGVHVPPPC